MYTIELIFLDDAISFAILGFVLLFGIYRLGRRLLI